MGGQETSDRERHKVLRTSLHGFEEALRDLLSYLIGLGKQLQGVIVKSNYLNQG